MIDLGVEHNVLTKSGAFLTFGECRLGRGRGAAKVFLDENPAMASDIEEQIYAALDPRRQLTPIERAQAA